MRKDFYAWTRDQAQALRRLAANRPNLALDLPHLIDEVADLGISQRDAVRSQLRRIIEHCLKLEYSPARDPPSEILPQRRTVEAFEVEHAFEGIGWKIMLLSARTLQRAGDRPALVLVTIEDVTEQRRSQWLLEHQKELAEKIVDTVREPLLVLHQDLRVQCANHCSP